jgi:hypothetical protein
MTRNKLSYLIIILSSISVFILIKINHTIFIDYSNSKGKTRALFGLKELLNYNYKRYFAIIPFIGFPIAIISTRIKLIRSISIIAALISLLAVILSLTSVWRIFV